MERLDLDAIARKWLSLCGACDAGLPMGCTCTGDDPRGLIQEMVSHLYQIYSNHTLLLASTMSEAVDELGKLTQARDRVQDALRTLKDPERDWCCSCPHDLGVVTELLEQ